MKKILELSLQESLEIFDYFYGILWKRTQLDHFKMWLELTLDFIKKEVGYHEDLPPFLDDLGLHAEYFDKRGNF